VVPPVIAQSFVAVAGPCAQARIVPGMSHDSHWERLWPSLLTIMPNCSSRKIQP